MTTLLITGGAGFIGSNFIRYWLQKYSKDRIINLDLLTYAGYLKNLEDIERKYKRQYLFVHGDIANQQLTTYLFKTYRPDMVVNFAAESHNSRAIIDPGSFMKTNALGTQQLLDVARICGVGRFHHVSTCEVYGDLALDSKEKFTEESPYRPRTPYNASKASADMIVRAYYETFHLPVTISICSNNYGPYQFPEKVIPKFVTSGILGEKLTLYKHSKNRREWLHVLDHCRAIELILTKGTVGEKYNIGSGFEADVETIADFIILHLKLNESLKTYVKDRPGHDRRYLLDSTKIRKKLDWEPLVDFKSGLKETIKWYVDSRKWWEPLLARLDFQESAWK